MGNPTREVAGNAAALSASQAMTAYASGRTEAFGAVYDGVAPRLEGYLRKHVKDASRVQDIVQQTFLQMHLARGTFIPGAEVLPWAFAIARRLMIDLQRKSSREESRDLSSDDEDGGARGLVSVESNGEEIVQGRETSRRLAAAYARLSEPQRQAFDLREEGLSCAEAASVLGTTVTGVKLRIHRALRALRLTFSESTESRAIVPLERDPHDPIA